MGHAGCQTQCLTPWHVALGRVEGLPARERQLQGGRAAGPAVELEGPADHPNALGDAHEAEATALRRLRERPLDLEAHAVVDDLHLDRTPPSAHAHRDVRRAGMLADVGERLLDDTEDGDPLGGGERVRVAADLELGADSGALREAVDLAMKGLAERPADDALRLERVRDLPELPVELDEARAQRSSKRPCACSR